MSTSKLLLLVALCALGCDSQAARDNIESLTCGLIPWYVADCTSPEVQDKALSILYNGAVEAQVTCDSVALGSGSDTTAGWWSLQATKMHDGSCLASGQQLRFNNTLGAAATRFSLRGTVDADECRLFAYVPHGLRIKFADGTITAYAGCASSCSRPISSSCTGFNLEAFGVE